MRSAVHDQANSPPTGPDFSPRSLSSYLWGVPVCGLSVMHNALRDSSQRFGLIAIRREPASQTSKTRMTLPTGFRLCPSPSVPAIFCGTLTWRTIRGASAA